MSKTAHDVTQAVDLALYASTILFAIFAAFQMSHATESIGADMEVPILPIAAHMEVAPLAVKSSIECSLMSFDQSTLWPVRASDCSFLDFD